jgi:hypothetical protein
MKAECFSKLLIYVFLPEYRFRSQMTFIIITAVITSHFTTSYLITGVFQNLAFSSCVDISCHADDSDVGSDGSRSSCGNDGDDDVMSMEAHRGGQVPSKDVEPMEQKEDICLSLPTLKIMKQVCH